ncbi:hypothetical protein [Floridanema evergladense]|uniref:Uncharacterized protein n=1 Tax=Floridaenema evergladense BLCC-F167 TaxID=3153639 RepID=A0ABV4WRG7_9CYAN
MDRIAIAQDTLKILEDGYYQSPESNRIDIAREFQFSTLEERERFLPNFLIVLGKTNLIN